MLVFLFLGHLEADAGILNTRKRVEIDIAYIFWPGLVRGTPQPTRTLRKHEETTIQYNTQ